MHQGKTFTIAPPPPKVPRYVTIWATPTSRTKVEQEPVAAPRHLKPMLKEVVRAVLPPIAVSALRRLRRIHKGQPAPVPVAAAAPVQIPTVNLAYRHALALAERVPELRDFGLAITPANAEAVLDFFNAYVPLVRPEARNTHLRTLMTRLLRAAPDLEAQVRLHIARSDLADGLPDRAQRLRTDAGTKDELEKQTVAFERIYGAQIITSSWGAPSRGKSILYYLQEHPSIVRGKDVLHIAPEVDTQSWLRSTSKSYTVLDGTPDDASDIAADVTEIPAAAAAFDVVICHRVLEHVFDDAAALREFFRILRPGGILNMSVPQAVHRPATAEWLVPDESHHGHVRHYGADLADRIASAGFQVRLVDWLVRQDRAQLLARSAFPLRMFEASKPA